MKLDTLARYRVTFCDTKIFLLVQKSFLRLQNICYREFFFIDNIDIFIITIWKKSKWIHTEGNTLWAQNFYYLSLVVMWCSMKIEIRIRSNFWSLTITKCVNSWFKDFQISAILHFASQQVGLRETKLWHFSLSRLFLALKPPLILNLYQFMAVILRYVLTFRFV